MTMKSTIVGFVRKATGGYLRITIDKETLASLQCFKGVDGKEFFSLYANSDKVAQILDGERTITSLVQREIEGDE